MFSDRDWGQHGTFGGWVAHFATLFGAMFLAVVLGGVFLGLGLRAYLHWSAADTVEKINKR